MPSIFLDIRSLSLKMSIQDTTNVSTGTYLYQHLTEADSIRLLLLHPGTEGAIYCSLIRWTLSICRAELVDHYVALSYVWGNLANPEIIWMDEVAVFVTKNLYEALCDLRDVSRTPRLWIDALCINQTCDEEKAIQVAMMGKIYAVADRTVIYLGRPTNREVSFFSRVLGASNLGRTSRILEQEDENVNKEEIELLLSKPWFRRVWIFQELVLSRDPWIQYGKQRINWEDFYASLRPLKQQDSFANNSNLKLLRDMELVRKQYRKEKSKIPIIGLLMRRRGLGASDPRDLIYAHCSMASDGNMVNVEYEQSTARAYGDFILGHMIREMNHELLSWAQDSSPILRLGGIPSWSPDWTSVRTMTRLPPCYYTGKSRTFGPLYIPLPTEVSRKRFCEGHTLLQHLDSRVLTCLGLDAATVRFTSSPLSGDDIELSKRADFSSRFEFLRKIWPALGAVFKEAKEGNDFRLPISSVYQDLYGGEQFAPYLRQLYKDIYNAWREVINDALILPSNEQEHLDELLDPRKDKIWKFCLWAFERKESFATALDEYSIYPGESEWEGTFGYYPLHGSTVDLLIHYFLPGFDKSIIDGRVLVQTTRKKDGLFLCPPLTKVDDFICSLFPISRGRDLEDGVFNFFVLRDHPGREEWISEVGDEIKARLKGSHSEFQSQYAGTMKNLRPKGPCHYTRTYIKDVPIQACTLVGEAYGRLSHHLLHESYKDLVCRPRNITEEKILAIF
jgi:hypothetical protein